MMRKNVNNLLYNNVVRKKIKISHAVEVGVSNPELSNIYGFIIDGVKSLLIEANPNVCREIEKFYEGKENVKICAKAISEEKGKTNLVLAGSSSFISSVESSPAMVNDNKNTDKEDYIEVETIPLHEVDDGSIDLISIDVEGAEWGVLKTMASRPKIISLETHGGIYFNPHLLEINEWMDREGYRLWYQDKSDSIYVDYSIKLTKLDAGYRLISKIIVNLKYTKKRISKKIKKIL